MRRTLVVAALFAFVGTLAGSTAIAAPKEESRSFKFELRALGGRVGDAVLSVGEVKRVGGHKLRPVRVDAKTEGLGKRVLNVKASATDWVDRRWYPVRGRWDSNDKKQGKRLVKARYDGKRIRGEDFRNGKLKNRMDRVLNQRANGLVSVFTWLMHQKLKPGKTYGTPVYDGKRIYWVTATVARRTEQVVVPVGVRQAYRLDITVKQGKNVKKRITYWLDPDDSTPYKIAFKYGLLGDVEAVLVAKKAG